jgi:putative FmdB family regulatory protein
MPFYEYECSACGHYHEAMQKMSDKLLVTCPACGKDTLVKLVSAPQFRLKGAGWYETDFKGDKDKQRNLADRPEAEPAKAEDKEGKIKVKPVRTGKPKPAAKSKAKPKRKAKPAKAAAKPKPKAKVTPKAKAASKPKPKAKAKAKPKAKAKAKPKAKPKAAKRKTKAARPK